MDFYVTRLTLSEPLPTIQECGIKLKKNKCQVFFFGGGEEYTKK